MGAGFTQLPRHGALKKRSRSLPSAATPALIGSGMLARLPKLGAEQVLIKPLDLDELVEVADRGVESGTRVSGFRNSFRNLFAKKEE